MKTINFNQFFNEAIEQEINQELNNEGYYSGKDYRIKDNKIEYSDNMVKVVLLDQFRDFLK